jgi:hypothetical protein
MRDINTLERKFKQYTKLPMEIDMTIFPITDHIGFTVDIAKKKANGEVFTPLQIVDHMIELSRPDPTKFNMDLCAGRGQFTIRMLRYFVNNYPDFNMEEYLINRHWFNEFNPDNAQDIINIFGNNINLCIGPAQKLDKMA